MNWEKLGNIFQVDNTSEWMCSHASVPTAVHLEKDIFRIFFSTRNSLNMSHGAFFDLDLSSLKIVKVSLEPVIAPGALGLFDDAGVTLSCYVPELESFYYMGWNLPKMVPFSNQIGAAKFAESKMNKLERFSVMPVLGKCEKEPFSFGYPWVMKTNGKFYMWYDSNPSWKNNSTEDYLFPLRMAESEDGRVWKKNYYDCLELREGERAIARPCVLH
ncbi:MAG: hypothetical protein K2X47_09865, partial [Bdellovibrionales bacterium]|nr:hypothetical protein [Bdellovibrionales bacterium]